MSLFDQGSNSLIPSVNRKFVHYSYGIPTVCHVTKPTKKNGITSGTTTTVTNQYAHSIFVHLQHRRRNISPRLVAACASTKLPDVVSDAPANSSIISSSSSSSASTSSSSSSSSLSSSTRIITQPSIGYSTGVSTSTRLLIRRFRRLKRVYSHLDAIYCVTYDQTGQRVLTGADDGLIKVYSTVTGELLLIS